MESVAQDSLQQQSTFNMNFPFFSWLLPFGLAVHSGPRTMISILSPKTKPEDSVCKCPPTANGCSNNRVRKG